LVSLVGWLFGWLLGWLVGGWVGWLVGWLVGRLFADWVFGWLVGWLGGAFNPPSKQQKQAAKAFPTQPNGAKPGLAWLSCSRSA
jgi:hypothetical protein